ncbi:transcription factor DYT1-like [Abrus precatorius]|uniref:Transcription factor DYT1-like n=1 Tax=Abrus precatorius TaxID=3816 RepID=A0A8B8L165_ABRPR|nr:transcription factor DYT1-like [Abrus precatorius]
MGQVYEDRLYVSLDELGFDAENATNRGKMRRNNYDYDTKVFKSKNLETERKRREKLSSRLLMLRSLMNKATIVEDAITYINMLQDKVQSLTQELQEMEATSEEITEPKRDEFNASEEMKKWGTLIQEEVQVTKIGGNKMWVKMIIEKKRGRFKKLMETMNTSGIELIDTNVTTINGAFLITTCMQGLDEKTREVQQTEELLLDIISGTQSN